jgi:hypothetical protein
MRRLLRDIIVTVGGGVIVSLILSFTTSLTRAQLIAVFALTLVACALAWMGRRRVGR